MDTGFGSRSTQKCAVIVEYKALLATDKTISVEIL